MGIKIAELVAQIKAEGAGSAVNQINKVGVAGDKTTKTLVDGNERTSRSFARMVKNAAGIAASLYLIKKAADTLFDAVSVTTKFETAISNLSAITGATGDDLKFLSDKSKEFGENTTLSATQAAEAFKLIASAKPDLLESVDALAAVTKETIVLAEASGSTLPEAAATLGSALNQFSADADQAGRFINVLAAGAKFGASEIADTAAALRDSGTVAASAGISFEELNASIQSLSTISIKGSRAGVGLRNIILKLQKEGHVLTEEMGGLTGAMTRLLKSGIDVTEVMDLFGLESVTAAQALIDNAEKLDDLTEKLTGTNIAYEQARINNDNLEGDVKRLSSAYESLQIQIGSKNTPSFRILVKTMTDVIKVFNETKISADNTTGTFETLSRALINISEFAQRTALEFGDLGDVIGAYSAIVGAVLTGEFELIDNIVKARKEQRESIDKEIISLSKRSDEIRENIEKNAELISSENELAATIAKTNVERAKTIVIKDIEEEEFDDSDLQKKIEALQKSLLTEKELIEESLLDKKLLIEAANDEEIISYQERSDLLLNIDNERNEKLIELDEKKLAREEAKTEQENERLLRGLENYENSLLTEEERLIESLERREFMVEDAFQRLLISEENKNDLLLGLEANFQQSRTELEKAATDKIISLKLSVVTNSIKLAKLLFGESKELAILSVVLAKGVAIAQTLAYTQTASMLAYASQLIPGDPSSILRAEAARQATLALGGISAGLIAATGLAEISNLSDSDFTDSGDSSSGGGSTGVNSNITDTTPQTQISPQNQRDQVQLTIIFQGDQIGWDQHIEERVFDGIKDIINNKDAILVENTSRNAEELTRTGT